MKCGFRYVFTIKPRIYDPNVQENHGNICVSDGVDQLLAVVGSNLGCPARDAKSCQSWIPGWSLDARAMDIEQPQRVPNSYEHPFQSDPIWGSSHFAETPIHCAEIHVAAFG